MARPRSPNRDKAFQLWLESGKKRKLKDIAAEIQVSEEQIRKWKNQDKWDKVTLPNRKSNVTKRNKGGQPGNRNAAGHGGTGPPGTKNAVTTGEFEALLFDCLDEDEKRLAEAVPEDKRQLLLQEIQLITVRERRMLKRIEAIRNSDGDQGDSFPEDGMTLVKRQTDFDKDLKEYRGKLGQIQAIEEALTRVQARKQKMIDSLHRFGYDDARLEIEMRNAQRAEKEAGIDDGGDGNGVCLYLPDNGRDTP